ncbi:MAG: hypothetical protein IPO52_13215 [Gemmatimonadetes bacterium]|nr:hypothetical protein [Gemmatimonadota bacterium]
MATRQRDVPALATRHRETVARLHRRGAEPHRLQLARALEEGWRHPVAPRRDAAGERARAVADGRDRDVIDRDDTTAEELGMIGGRLDHHEVVAEGEDANADAGHLRRGAAAHHQRVAVVGERHDLGERQHHANIGDRPRLRRERREPLLGRRTRRRRVCLVHGEEVSAKSEQVLPLGRGPRLGATLRRQHGQPTEGQHEDTRSTNATDTGHEDS